jgi:serine/threonine-protein kinase
MADDDTRPFLRLPGESDARPTPPVTGGDPAATAPVAPTGPAPAGSTPPADPQATVVGGPPADGTQVLPPVSEDATPRWSARAQVRPAGVEDDAPAGPWTGSPDDGPERKAGFFSPAVIAVLVVVLLALTGLGVWLALRDSGPAPLPPPTSSPTASPTPTRTTPPPTTTEPEPTTPPPATVLVPDLEGRSYDSAAAELTGMGLVPQRREETSTTVPAGRVIRTEPGADTQVLPGETIRVFVSTGAPTTVPPTTEPGPGPT